MAAHDEPSYKPNALKAAHDLGYSDETIRKITKAKTDSEISRIMAQARKEKFG